MSTPAADLRRALGAFRRAQGLAYLQRLSGQPVDPVPARRFLGSEAALERFAKARSDAEFAPGEEAALGAHMARAALEEAYEPARLALSALPAQSVGFEGEPRRVRQLWGEFCHSRSPAQRSALARACDGALSEVARVLLERRAAGEAQAGALLARLSVPRHADAGPAGGSAEAAERWLSVTEDLCREAFAHARRTFGVEGAHGLDTLWCALGTELSGLFTREGRMRRLAADWEPLDLRRLLRAHARVAPEHPGPFPAPHVIVLSAPTDIRVAPSAMDVGLAGELSAAEALGRALAHAHASPALPLALRHASAASVARATGALGMLRFAEPLFLRRVRDLSQRESEAIARLAAAFALLDSRLSAASVLARSLRAPSDLEALSALSARALGGGVPAGLGALLVLRLSSGAAFRAKAFAPALLWALRERFDEDWFFNPRAAEPIRGALARAGEFSVEAWAEELGLSGSEGPSRLGELF